MVVLGVTLAKTGLRLGDKCEHAKECNSGCCWYGVCRAGFADCSPQAQLATYSEYKAAEQDLMVNTFVGKILLLAERTMDQETTLNNTQEVF